MSAAHSLPAFFVRDGDNFVATESTRGPWSRDYQHGGPPAALLTRELERLAGDGALLTRLTFDFLRPVPIARLAVRAETVRAGAKVRRLQAMLTTAEGTPLVQAAAVAMRTAAVLPAALGDDDPGPLPVERATPFQFGFFPDPVGYHTAMEIRVASGRWGKGPMAAWMRPRVALVEGETVSALQRLMIAVDSASGIAVVVEPAHYTFVNADLTVAIHRAPKASGCASTPPPWWKRTASDSHARGYGTVAEHSASRSSPVSLNDALPSKPTSLPEGSDEQARRLRQQVPDHPHGAAPRHPADDAPHRWRLAALGIPAPRRAAQRVLRCRRRPG